MQKLTIKKKEKKGKLLSGKSAFSELFFSVTTLLSAFVPLFWQLKISVDVA